MCDSELQCVGGLLHHTATHYNSLQHAATRCNSTNYASSDKRTLPLCNVSRDPLQRTATHCNALQRTATHCNILRHTSTRCKILQHTTTAPTARESTSTLQRHTRFSSPPRQLSPHFLSFRYQKIPSLHTKKIHQRGNILLLGVSICLSSNTAYRYWEVE